MHCSRCTYVSFAMRRHQPRSQYQPLLKTRRATCGARRPFYRQRVRHHSNGVAARATPSALSMASSTSKTATGADGAGAHEHALRAHHLQPSPCCHAFTRPQQVVFPLLTVPCLHPTFWRCDARITVVQYASRAASHSYGTHCCFCVDPSLRGWVTRRRQRSSTKSSACEPVLRRHAEGGDWCAPVPARKPAVRRTRRAGSHLRYRRRSRRKGPPDHNKWKAKGLLPHYSDNL